MCGYDLCNGCFACLIHRLCYRCMTIYEKNLCLILQKNCKPCEGIGEKLSDQAILQHLKHVHQAWQYDGDQSAIRRSFRFKNHYEVLAFVNAVAWISHQEDHHPTLTVHYNHCDVLYATHALGGVTENDFICASQVDNLLASHT